MRIFAGSVTSLPRGDDVLLTSQYHLPGTSDRRTCHLEGGSEDSYDFAVGPTAKRSDPTAGRTPLLAQTAVHCAEMSTS